jgi:hypothetical protein
MAEGARVYSIDAIKIFRAGLIKYGEAGNVALTAADGDIDRVLGWLERDQTSFWAGQVRKRHEYVQKCEDAVRQKRIFKGVDGTSQSAVDEIKELQRAKRAEEEAVMKVGKIKQAIGVLRKESMLYKGRVMRYATAVQSDIPKAVHSLDRMLDDLDKYLQIQTTGEGIAPAAAEAMSRGSAEVKVGLERYRARTPTPEQRMAAPQIPVAPDHAMQQPWGVGVIADWQLKALGGLSFDRQIPDPDHRIVVHPDVWQKPGVYLERLEPTTDSDSGWYLGPATDAPITPGEEIAYEAYRLGDVIAARPDLADLLALPTASLIVLDAGGPTAIFDQLGLDIWALALIKAAEPEATEAPAEQSANAT